MTCTSVLEKLLPQARDLALARIAVFARDLGVTAGTREREDLPTIPTPGPMAGGGYDRSGCGMPKYGRYPLTANVHETYTLASRTFAIAADGTRPSLSPVPSPPELAPFNYPVMPPVVPHNDLRVASVSALGYATVVPDSIELEILILSAEQSVALHSNTPTQDPALIAPVNAAILRAWPTARIEDRFSGTTGIGDRRVLANTHVFVDAPDATTILAIDRALVAARPPNTNVFVARLARSTSCESLEEAARRDAIARARSAIFERTNNAKSVELTFADEQPLYVVGGICGPIIDAPYQLHETREVSIDAAIPLEIGAYDSMSLRFEMRAP